jgi:hypothetical protein
MIFILSEPPNLKSKKVYPQISQITQKKREEKMLWVTFKAQKTFPGVGIFP